MIRAFFLAVLIGAGSAASVHAQEYLEAVVLSSGESRVVGRADYVNRSGGRCRTRLVSLGPLDVLQGHPAVEISIKEQPVKPPRCFETVNGGIVTLKAGVIDAPFSGQFVYRMRYNTLSGVTLVYSHKIELTLKP